MNIFKKPKSQNMIPYFKIEDKWYYIDETTKEVVNLKELEDIKKADETGDWNEYEKRGLHPMESGGKWYMINLNDYVIHPKLLKLLEAQNKKKAKRRN